MNGRVNRFKLLFAVVAGLLGLVLVGYVVKLYLLPSPTTAAEGFLRTVAKDGPDAGWQATAPDFRAHGTRDQFLALVARLGLLDVESATWSEPVIDGTHATLTGALALQGGMTVPLKLSLERQEGAWAVAGITSSADGSEFRKLLPDADGAKKLVRTTLVRLAHAIEQHDFTPLRDEASPLLRARISAAGMAERFALLGLSPTDIAQLGAADPVFDHPPALNADGELTATGTAGMVASEPRWRFAIRYVYLHPEWKLDGLDLDAATGAGAAR
jgi:hypothetical protein